MPGHAKISMVYTLPPMKGWNPVILLPYVNTLTTTATTFAAIPHYPAFAPAASSACQPFTCPAGDILVILQNQFRSTNGSGAGEYPYAKNEL